MLKSSGNLEPTAKVVGDDGTTPSLSSPTCISGLDSNEVFPTTLSSSTATDVIISANPSVLLSLPVETKKVSAENTTTSSTTVVEVRPNDPNLKKTGGSAVGSKSLHNTMVDDEKTMKRLVKSSNNLTCTLLGFGESLSMASTPKSSPYSFRPKRAKSDDDSTATHHKDSKQTQGSSNVSGKENQDSSDGSGHLPLSAMVKVTSPSPATAVKDVPDLKKNPTPKKAKVPSTTSNIVVRAVPNVSLIASSFAIMKRSSNDTTRENRFAQLPNIAYKCNCKKSGCLKLYCDCFRFSQRCGDECNCM